MKKFQPTLEHGFYALALILAVGLRFIHLDLLPLSDYEARWALQSLHVVQGLQPAIGSNPGYVHLTAILFYIFGATNFLARFWSALAGTALVLAPWLVRSRLGRLPALILAFGLALDPGLVAMSHLTGGPMLAITSVVLAVLMWMKDHRSTAGFFAGLALLSGQSFWLGLFGLLLGWAFVRLIMKKPVTSGDDETRGAVNHSGIPSAGWRYWSGALGWCLGIFLVLGSLFLLSPKGLPAVAISFIDFMRGWWTLSSVPIWQPLLALPAYEILPLGFGIAGAVRGLLKRDRDTIVLAAWALAALIVAVIYPGRQVGDLCWTLLPLWALAAFELSHHLDIRGHNLWQLTAVATLIITLLVFGWLDLASVTNMDLTTDMARTRMYLLIPVVLLVGLSILLAGAGWSSDVARLGGVWAGVITLTLFTLGMSTGAGGVREPLTVELWQPYPRAGRLDVLLDVANQISDMNKGSIEALPLTIQGVDSPSLLWLFRNWQIQQVTALASDTTPEMVITPSSEVSLAANYRGEALPLAETVNWSQATLGNWLEWLVYRQMPISREEVILWVRSDLMLDSQGAPSTSPNP